MKVKGRKKFTKQQKIKREWPTKRERGWTTKADTKECKGYIDREREKNWQTEREREDRERERKDRKRL
jgi:hypothetical protein